ncbi:MAG TPA: hypothetical protein VJ824_09870 [Bacillota bacterium]|nr:hypothetical protein [Bacillota bacterium]
MIKVRQGKLSDIDALLELEYRIFPKQWHIPNDFPEKMMKKNQHVLRVVEEEGALKGHYYFLPLSHSIYELVLHGELDEKELAKYILPYPIEGEAYLYLMCIIVDTQSSSRHQYADALIDDMREHLSNLQKQGMNLKEFGGIFISKGGVKVASALGMNKTGEITYSDGITYSIYRG